MNRLTIGILVTNTDRSAFARAHPGDGEKFTSLLQHVRPQWRYRIYDCTAGELPAHVRECDGYVIGGSPASVNGGEAWIADLLDFIRKLHAEKQPAVGCCFGHQAIAKALGGTIGRNPDGWGFGIAATHFTETFAWMEPPSAVIKLYAAHAEQVVDVPHAARVIGGDSFCPAASLLVDGHFLTTEYHPEMTEDFFIGLTHAFEKDIGEEVAGKARVEAAHPADGSRFAGWMARFLEMERDRVPP